MRKPVPICAYTLDNPNIGTFFPSMDACAKELNLQCSHVSEVCAGIRPQHKGYTFKPVYAGYYEERRKKA